MSTPTDAQIHQTLLREARERKGWTQAELAGVACLSVKQVRQIEEGGQSAFYSEAVKLTAAKKVAQALGLPPQAAFISDDAPAPDVATPPSAPSAAVSPAPTWTAPAAAQTLTSEPPDALAPAGAQQTPPALAPQDGAATPSLASLLSPAAEKKKKKKTDKHLG